MMAVWIACGLALIAAICLVRVFTGPTTIDRVIGAGASLIAVALVLAAIAVTRRAADLVYLSLALVMANLVFRVIVLKLQRMRSFQAPLLNSMEL